MLNRAYSIIDIKAIDEDDRTIRGIATTPTADRLHDIVEPEGAKFTLPLPLLWQHDSREPIGHVTEAKVTKNGIEIAARIERVDEPASLKEWLDTRWAQIKARLVRGLSIGFRSLESEPIKGGGIRFKSWEFLELSAVTIPANQQASIQVIKEFDIGTAAASGHEAVADEDPAPGVPGRSRPVKVERIKPMDARTPIAEQIASFEATRSAKQARMTAILTETAGSTLDERQKEEFDCLRSEVGEIDEHLVRLGESERLSKATAKPIGSNNAGASSIQLSAPRSAPRIEVRGHNLPKGTAFTRYGLALLRCKGDLGLAVNVAREWHDSTPEVETVLKAAVAAGTTAHATWAAPLVEMQAMASEFVELLYPATIIGRIPGLRRVPFNIKVPRATSGASAGWVGEGAPKPLSALAFDTITLGFYKAAVVVVLTEELVRFSNPSAEALVRSDLIAAIAQFLDSQFLDPAKAAVANVSPASISNGVTPVTPSGTSAEALRVDLATLMSTFIAANKGIAGAVWVMTPSDALKISMMQNPLGQAQFPSVSPEGGTLLGIPLVTSTNIVAGASGSRIYLINAPDILLAEDGIMLDISREASVQMNSTPDSPATATTVMVSLWQHNLVGLRAERFINYLPRRTGSVAWIENADYEITSGSF